MKYAAITIGMTLFLAKSFAQEVKLADLKTPNSPGFQILDIAPASIERPTNPKEFSLKVLNLVGNGNAIPKNFAFEFSPFWFFKPQNESVYKYLNIKEVDSTVSGKGGYLYQGILRKLSVSLASTFADSTSGTLLKNTNYIAIGVRTNLLTIRTGVQNKTMSDAILAAARRQSAVSTAIGPNGTRPSLEEIEKILDKDPVFQQQIETLKKLPLLQLDIAYAYSNAFRENKYSNRRFNKSGFWATLAVNAQFKKINHTLSFIGLFKASRDNVLTDTTANLFNTKSFVDYGGKIEYNLNKFSLSAEYLKRNYKDLSSINTERTAGILQYKINDNLYVLGTFGKNFGNVNNVFTMLGINWGFGNSPLSL